ncbi:hypothetical protein BDN72DRAFT_907321 [Pluteus cervinus]|uniref:Uncharacterized protein n=1 Tax=Pluteus cervinus TaxID=181527 RepID=A0ACD2ZX17_9AGAR|nr:hypothetical protein BDN72DRAFT_907321 [Pluteus cervinus]
MHQLREINSATFRTRAARIAFLSSFTIGELLDAAKIAIGANSHDTDGESESDDSPASSSLSSTQHPEHSTHYATAPTTSTATRRAMDKLSSLAINRAPPATQAVPSRSAVAPSLGVGSTHNREAPVSVLGARSESSGRIHHPIPSVPGVGRGTPSRGYPPSRITWQLVTMGYDVGVYPGWDQTAPLVSGVPGARYRKVGSEAEGWRLYHEACDRGEVHRLPMPQE